MSNVINLEEARKERYTHLSGKATCVNCLHQWEAVAPVGTVDLECPSCKLMHGRFLMRVRDDALHWTCMNCENQLFSITPSRTYCVNRGDTMTGF